MVVGLRHVVFNVGMSREICSEALSCSEITGDSSEDGTQLQPLWRCRISSRLRFSNGTFFPKTAWGRGEEKKPNRFPHCYVLEVIESDIDIDMK